jgi:hypothetical protein
MNSELTVTSAKPTNVCRDFWALVYHAIDE